MNIAASGSQLSRLQPVGKIRSYEQIVTQIEEMIRGGHFQIGDKMPDGTVYAGVSPDSGKALYAMPADAPLSVTFNGAQKYAETLDAHGHQDWRVPTKNELNLLFNNLAAVGGFRVSGSYPGGWYWSSSSYTTWSAWIQRFRGGYQNYNFKVTRSSVRCVR